MRMERQRTVPLLVDPLRRHSVSLESLRVSPFIRSTTQDIRVRATLVLDFGRIIARKTDPVLRAMIRRANEMQYRHVTRICETPHADARTFLKSLHWKFPWNSISSSMVSSLLCVIIGTWYSASGGRRKRKLCVNFSQSAQRMPRKLIRACARFT